MSVVGKEAQPLHVVRGVTLIVGAMFITSVQDVIFKLFSNELTLWQIFTLRGLLALPLLVILAWVKGIRGAVFKGALQKWPLLRSLFLTISFVAYYAAIPFLSLSTVGAANYIAPIFVTLLSAYVISEPVSLRGWVAVFVGFAGVIILLQPGTDAFSPWAVLPVFGAFFYAISHIITRAKCQSIPLATMALAITIVMLSTASLVSGILLLWHPSDELTHSYPYIFSEWSPIGTSGWFVLGLLAALNVVIGLGLAGAYQAAPPSIVATFEYCYLIFVAVWDYLFFATTPGGATVIGILLIVGAGLMVLRRK